MPLFRTQHSAWFARCVATETASSLLPLKSGCQPAAFPLRTLEWRWIGWIGDPAQLVVALFRW
jgi:hypothetical protein